MSRITIYQLLEDDIYGIDLIVHLWFRLHSIEIPQYQPWRGEEAIEALHEIIKEFEQRKGRELTGKQADTMIKFATGLITAIEAEIAASKSGKAAKVEGFIARLKATIMRTASDSSLNHRV